MVVFFAIMLHKAPSAFALTTVLLSEGLSRARVRQHLLMFSVSAPIGAISTYLLLLFFSSASSSESILNLEYWTGILLLFSGGTFLYVAMHAIQELQQQETKKKMDWSQMGSIFIGMFIPFILNFNHSHS
jgi:zinc transporter 9